MRIVLCLNCLGDKAGPVNVGPMKGIQYDFYHDTIDLCTPCKDALLKGDFSTLASRHTNTRTIIVGAQGER